MFIYGGKSSFIDMITLVCNKGVEVHLTGITKFFILLISYYVKNVNDKQKEVRYIQQARAVQALLDMKSGSTNTLKRRRNKNNNNKNNRTPKKRR